MFRNMTNFYDNKNKATRKDIIALKRISRRVYYQAWLHHITAISIISKGLVETHDGGLITLSEKGKLLIHKKL